MPTLILLARLILPTTTMDIIDDAQTFAPLSMPYDATPEQLAQVLGQ